MKRTVILTVSLLALAALAVAAPAVQAKTGRYADRARGRCFPRRRRQAKFQNRAAWLEIEVGTCGGRRQARQLLVSSTKVARRG
jgi:hypothetical protein